MKHNRPTSPHLTIYKIQITSLMSITHRISGIVLFTNLCILTLWCSGLFLSGFNECYFKPLVLKPIIICLYLITLAFTYHMLNGIRHLCFDAGYGFELSKIDASGRFVIMGTVISMIILTLYI